MVLPFREDELVVNQNCQAQQIEFMVKPTLRVNQSAAQGVSKISLRTLFDNGGNAAAALCVFTDRSPRGGRGDRAGRVSCSCTSTGTSVDSPRAWLFRSVRNRAFNHIRDNKRETLQQLMSATSQSPNATKTKHPRLCFCGWKPIGALRKILDELDEADRQLVKLKYFEGLKYRDISAQTGLSISNVGYRLHHILKELADKLRPLGIDGVS